MAGRSADDQQLTGHVATRRHICGPLQLFETVRTRGIQGKKSCLVSSRRATEVAVIATRKPVIYLNNL
jgi:hypothetical protein